MVKRAARKHSRKPSQGRSRAAATRGGAQKKIAKRKTATRAVAGRSRSVRRPRRPSRVSVAAALARGAAAELIAAVAQRLPWSQDENDPIVLLETDHRRFEELLKQGEETTDRAVKRRTAVLERLTTELTVHELLEERILYPALKPHPEAREIVLEGYQEHHVADLIVKELHELGRQDEQWGAKFKVLKENIEHHIEEEERKMFRTARAILSRDELADLGVRMKALKAELEK